MLQQGFETNLTTLGDNGSSPCRFNMFQYVSCILFLHKEILEFTIMLKEHLL